MKCTGVHLPHRKDSQYKKTEEFKLPEKVVISMSQHMGAPCNPLVKVGDMVFVGQKIGETEAFMSVPIHSSVSGKVVALNDLLLANGNVCKGVEIETDGLQTVHESIVPPVISNRASFIEAVKNSGCCGVGGAGFPTHIKFSFDRNVTPIDTLVINAAECEPYITSDYREMIEHPEDILTGIELVKKYLGIKFCYIGIETNKPQAIKKLENMCKTKQNIAVFPLKPIYPQGAEKVLIYNVTGRIVQEGQLPSHQNVMVSNVSTMSFISKFARTGMPLVKKRVTVAGDLVKEPTNYFVPVGTRVADILSECKVDFDKISKVLAGGPMMGMPLYDLNATITKTNNAILAFSSNMTAKKVQTACIRCGSCVNACPMGLMPLVFEKAYDNKDVDVLIKNGIMTCMNCGSCSYVCPANRSLAEKNQLAKTIIPRK